MALDTINRWKGSLAVVTGASKGIGRAISIALVQRGIKVVGCARSLNTLEEIQEECKSKGYDGTFIAYKCDLADDTMVANMFKWIESSNLGPVRICVCNAGFSVPFNVLDISVRDMRHMLDVNVVGLIQCAKLAVESMKKADVEGHIFNISSMSGHRLTGTLNFYASTKFNVKAVTEGMRRELAENKKIRVTAISPGIVETDFAIRCFGEEIGRNVYKSFGQVLKPENIADILIFGLSTPPNVQIHDILVRPTGSDI